MNLMSGSSQPPMRTAHIPELKKRQVVCQWATKKFQQPKTILTILRLAGTKSSSEDLKKISFTTDPSSLNHRYYLHLLKGFKDLKLNKMSVEWHLCLVAGIIVRSFMVRAVDYLIATWTEWRFSKTSLIRFKSKIFMKMQLMAFWLPRLST